MLLNFEDFSVAAFSVDNERRTLTSLVVPWNRIGYHRNGDKWRFARGSLRYGHEKYIQLNNDHDHAQRIGRAIAAEDTDAGLVMTFKVKDGPAGDRVLAMAKDGSKTGFSVEVDIDGMDTESDPENPGTKLINMANLTMVAFVREPAFDDSRLITVMANRDGGNMHCATCGQDHAVGVACPTPTPTATPPTPLTFSADQLAWMQANGFGANQPAPVPAPEPARAEEIPQRRRPAEVTESESYRFDREGNLHAAAHDFGVDMVRGMNPKFNDHAARDRAEAFIQAHFDVVSTDVNETNPTINQNRYIDQREYRSPVWEAISKGAPPNGIQPFAWPKFSSASGLVGAHTEGVEPSSGTYVTTNQTVTPSATSGKAKISRETWDMGGTPGTGNLIWRQMTRGYVEALEAKAIAVLDAASPTQIDFSGSPGLADGDLDQALTQALARLQFIRGGFTMDAGFSQIDFYLALVGATDSTGRRLYPAIGPTNANGTVSQRYASVNTNGVVWDPSWALAATGSVAASSYLFDRLSVDGWATPPRQLLMPEIEVANVYIGIWGYSAAAINDIAGVREVVYDPS